MMSLCFSPFTTAHVVWHRQCCILAGGFMTTPSLSPQQQQEYDRLSAMERQLKQERLDLVRAMTSKIAVPDIVESHSSALAKIQERLESLRTERRNLTGGD
jgi:hypothetical protein